MPDYALMVNHQRRVFLSRVGVDRKVSNYRSAVALPVGFRAQRTGYPDGYRPHLLAGTLFCLCACRLGIRLHVRSPGGDPTVH